MSPSKSEPKKVKKTRNRRIRNYVLQPFLQIKLGLYTIIITFLFSGLFAVLLEAGLGRLYEVILDLTDLPDEVRSIVSDHVRNLSGWLLFFLAIYAIAVVLVSIIYTHKLIGPTIAFRRVIKDLREKRYNSRVVIRKGDAFAEVAEEINKLAESLEKKS